MKLEAVAAGWDEKKSVFALSVIWPVAMVCKIGYFPIMIFFALHLSQYNINVLQNTAHDHSPSLCICTADVLEVHHSIYMVMTSILYATLQV